MDIDLAQLPVPDWPLNCPQCGYPLRGLPVHRCPECGAAFDVPEMVRPWTRLREPRFTGHELPLPDFGLRCKPCGVPLAGATQHVCPLCRTPFDPQTDRPREPWFALDRQLSGGVPVWMVQLRLAAEKIPHMRADELTFGELYAGPSVIIQRFRVPTEFYFDVLWLVRDAARELAATRALDIQAQWPCAHCGESNPGHFEVCWNCEKDKRSE